LQLTGVDLRPAAPARGAELQLNLHWQSVAWLPEDDSVFVQLQSAAGEALAQRDHEPVDGIYPTTLWTPGTYVTDPYTLTLPADLAPGIDRLVAGVHRPNGQRLPVTGTPAGLADAVVVGQVYLPDPLFTPDAITNRVVVTGGAPAKLRLLGYSLPASPLAAGTDLNLTLFWQALGAMDVDYTGFVHVVDTGGQVRAQADAPPLAGRAPTSWWQPGQQFRDPRTVPLGADLPPGLYRVQVGLYYWATGERLPLFDRAGQRLPDDTVDLGPITVTGH
jgi:hypothetical protein